MRDLIVPAATLACMLAAKAACASGGDPAAAEVLFREGRSLVGVHDYPHACPKFAESLRLDRAPGTLLNLANCEEHLHEIAAAWAHYGELAKELPASDERQAFAAERWKLLEPQLSVLTIRSSRDYPADARILRDDVELGPSSLDVPLPVDPGPHTVRIESGSLVLYSAELELAAGQSRTVGAESLRPDASTARRVAARTTGFILGGFGLAALGAGVALGSMALVSNGASASQCMDGVCGDAASARSYDDARGQARAADIALGVGIAATVVAGCLLFLSSRGPGPRTPTPAPASALASGAVRW